MIQEKKIKYLTEQEFIHVKKISKIKPLSPFAQFNTDLIGYQLSYKGNDIYKWEAFSMGFDKSEPILKDMSVIKCRLKPE